MTKASRIDNSQKFPCWVYYSEHPVQIQACKTKKAWHYMRRHGWARIDPGRVGSRLRNLFKDMQFNEADAYTYVLLRTHAPEAEIIKQGLFYRIVRGTAPDAVLRPELLDQLSDVFCVPVDYFYLSGVHGVPLLFGDVVQRRVSAQLIVQPYVAPSVKEYGEASDRGHPIVKPPGKQAQYANAYDVPHRVYHLIYELYGAEQHRVHVIASNQKNAVTALKTKHSDAVVLECSSQKLKEGMIIENY